MAQLQTKHCFSFGTVWPQLVYHIVEFIVYAVIEGKISWNEILVF
jgi:hypothetical protein